jgi:predicted Fe-S protein YdhL (DUF1289 family)
VKSEELEKPLPPHDDHGPANHTPPDTPVSPCVRLCRIEPESQLCWGCGRSLDEIARWTTMSEGEKALIWQRLVLSPKDNNHGMLVAPVER